MPIEWLPLTSLINVNIPSLYDPNGSNLEKQYTFLNQDNVSVEIVALDCSSVIPSMQFVNNLVLRLKIVRLLSFGIIFFFKYKYQIDTKFI